MPYRLNGAGYGVARRRNPWVYSSSPMTKVPAKAARAYGRRKKAGKPPKAGVMFLTPREFKAVGGPGPMAGRGISRPASKSAKRRAAAKKAARTRKANKLARSRRAKKAASSRKRRGGKRPAARRGKRHGLRLRRRVSRPLIKRTRVHATVARVRRRGQRRGRLVFLVPKKAKRFLRGKRWAKHKIRYNPYGRNPGGLLETLKSVFTFETVKVVGGGLVGFSVAAGLGEALARVTVKDPSKKTLFVVVGLGTGVGVSVGGGWLIGKYSPSIGRAFLWGGLLGTVIRALAAAMPGKGFDMPRSASEADALAVKLHQVEAAKGAPALQTPAGAAMDQLYRQAQQLAGGSRDYLMQQGARDYLPAGTQDYIGGSFGGGQGAGTHPMVASSGGGQSW